MSGNRKTTPKVDHKNYLVSMLFGVYKRVDGFGSIGYILIFDFDLILNLFYIII